ncbi:hypothetical protein LDJ81_03455 [Lentilactobacillus parabuchneri]|uniref:hypothetical protein n=1 Tax=Lentilactobacillus parabuchneri TaxID=152331 RepID=UPI00223613C8|nr:hypothetical protein [Lentilactobacillus parabuchneri]MCW4398088.1 hypothetical protein [Lentilactobacillus parabuchneri]
MIGILFRSIVFFSSYIPIFIMIFLKQMSDFSQKSFQKVWEYNSVFWIILVCLSIISLVCLFVWIHILKKSKNSDKDKFPLENLKSYDAEVLNYFITFIIPILSLDVESWPSIVLNTLLLIIEGIYYVSNNAVYNNVILLACGYHIYTFNGNRMLISKKDKSELLFNKEKVNQIGTTNIFYL